MKNIISLIVIVVMLAFIPYGAWQIWENYQEESLSSNPQRIFEETLQKAEAGDAEAQYQMGLKYHLSRNGLSKDPLEAMKWYEKAAEQGHVKAQYNLGYLYDDKKDFEKAIYWYKKAAEQGFMEAWYNLGHVLYNQGSYDDAIIWLKKAAKQDYARANYYLGWHYYNRKEYEAALPWLLKASELGDSRSYKYLGNLYNQGNGVEQDLLKAGSLYKKAADLGEEPSQDYLEKISDACVQLFAPTEEQVNACFIAAGADITDAQRMLSMFYYHSQGVEQDNIEALAWTLVGNPSFQGREEEEFVVRAIAVQTILLTSLSKNEIEAAAVKANEYRARIKNNL